MQVQNSFSFNLKFLFFSLINKNFTCILIKRFKFDSFLYTVLFYIVNFNFRTF